MKGAADIAVWRMDYAIIAIKARVRPRLEERSGARQRCLDGPRQDPKAAAQKREVVRNEMREDGRRKASSWRSFERIDLSVTSSQRMTTGGRADRGGGGSFALARIVRAAWVSSGQRGRMATRVPFLPAAKAERWLQWFPRVGSIDQISHS